MVNGKRLFRNNSKTTSFFFELFSGFNFAPLRVARFIPTAAAGRYQRFEK
jgi:hypothetical protein